MSERVTHFLSSIGLLGEYCPTSRKKDGSTADKVGCMHLGLIEGCKTHFLGYLFMRPFPVASNLSLKKRSLVPVGPTVQLCPF
ncbi:hypothetical protein L484_014936 [Morus notabilis]|uniref:Uncharacterized protein n=1 Tax=Morus notabilis TaxID=981085 RepID=W9QZ52_9ROSA|nr:hypothetical protein L484_014936 [Morus notabilis]